MMQELNLVLQLASKGLVSARYVDVFERRGNRGGGGRKGGRLMTFTICRPCTVVLVCGEAKTERTDTATVAVLRMRCFVVFVVVVVVVVVSVVDMC